MTPIHVIGLGLSPEDLSPRLSGLLHGAGVLAGGRRLLDGFPEHPGDRIVLAGPVASWVEQIDRASRAGRPVAVLASGDPGFFGIAARLIADLGAERVIVHPNVTALQAAFARFGLPWHDALPVSIHGRDTLPLLRALTFHDTIGVYTDPERSPDHLARLMLDRGLIDWRFHVAEDLGGPEERCGAFTPEEAAARTFSNLNVVLLTRTLRPRTLRLGLPDEAFVHEAGLITKSEIRSVVLGRLALEPENTLWDLGAGCGSVSVEASLLLRRGRVVAVERKPERVRAICENRRRFGIGHLEIVEADLPAGLDGLPDPDRVFIGGGGPEMDALVRICARRLPPGGVLAAAVVRLESLAACRRAADEARLEHDVTQIQVSRSRPLTGDLYLQALNPVWIVRAVKSEPAP